MTAQLDTRLTRPWLSTARAGWLMVALLALGVVIVGIAPYYAALSSVCTDAAELCLERGFLAPADVRTYQAAGISLDFYAAYKIVLDLLSKAVWCAVGLLIFARKSDDWMALMVSLFLITFGTATLSTSLIDMAAMAYPALRLPVQFVAFAGDMLALGFFLLFPGGRLAPRWTRWVALVVTVLNVANYFFPQSPLNSDRWPVSLSVVQFSLFLGVLLYSQIYRYRYVSTPVERFQTRWIVTALAIALPSMFSVYLVLLLTESFNSPRWLWGETAVYLFMGLVPLAIGVSIFRYRLFDIDLLIRRTLVYGALTGALALVYFGSVVLLQSLVTALAPVATLQGSSSGQQSGVAIVVSTLAIAALFSPLRRRVQVIIDRRFYRRKYNAEKILADFATTVRDETDLDQLTGELTHVVQETMQPEHVSLWLRPTEDRISRPMTKDERRKPRGYEMQRM